MTVAGATPARETVRTIPGDRASFDSSISFPGRASSSQSAACFDRQDSGVSSPYALLRLEDRSRSSAHSLDAIRVIVADIDRIAARV
jgi:hypothetical protein